MAGVTVEQLNFELLIDDKEFNAKVQETLKTAEELNANLSKILDIKSKISSVSSADVTNQKNANKILADNAKTQEKIATDAERAAQARRKAAETTTSQITRENARNREIEAREALKTAMAQERLNQLQERGRRSLQVTSKLWQQMAAMAATYFSVAGATRLVSTLVQVSAEFEMQKTTLGAILQDTQKAGELYEQIKDLAVLSPFSFKELTTYAKQLSAFSIPVGELYDTTKMLADVSAGLGVGMDRLVLAYGQIRSASFLRGQEVRQLTEAGIPILEELRKQFVALGEEGITVGDVFDKISKRLVPFSMVEKVFKDMTSEGGKFYQMQEVQAETLKGKISNLTDAYQIMFSEIGEKHEGLLKGSVDALRGIAENYQKIGSILIGLVTTYGAYRAALVAIHALEVARLAHIVSGTNTLKLFGAEMLRLTGIMKAYQKVVAALKNMNWAAVGIGAVVGLGTALANAAIQAHKFRKELDGIVESHASEATKMVEEYHRLVGELEGVTQGSQAYRDAISELNRKYGEYLPNLLTEQTSLAELKRLEGELTNAIYARARAYAEAEGAQKIENRYGKGVNKALSNFMNSLDWAGVTGEVATKFSQHLRDEFMGASRGELDDIFEETFKNYFGDDEYNAVKDNVELWDDLVLYATQFGISLKRVNKETAKFSNVMSARFGNFMDYDSFAERNLMADSDKWYAGEQARIRGLKMTEEETTKALQKAYADYLKMKKAAYEADEKNGPGVWASQIKEIDNALKSLNGGELSTFQKMVNPLITGEGVKDLLVQAGDDQSEYFDKLRKDYKTTTDKLKDADAVLKKLLDDKKKGLEVDEKALKSQQDSVNQLENRKRVIESIGSNLGISIDDKLKKTTGSRSQKSQAQIDLENQISTLKDLYTWYQRFSDLGVSDTQTKGILSQFFPDEKDLIDGNKLKEQLLANADAMEKYGAAGKKAAADIRDFIGVNSVKGRYDTFKDQLASFQKYRKQVQDWMDKDYGLEGKDISLKASRILTELATKNAQTATDANELKKLFAEATADEEALKFIRELYGEEVWEKYMEKGEEVIDNLAKSEIEANKTIAQDKINNLADAYVRQQLFEKDLDLTDWGDKSYNQIKAISEQLKTMFEAPIEMSDEMRQKAEKLGINLDELASLIKKIFGEKWQNATVEEMKKFVDVAKSVSSSVSELGGMFSDLGEGVGSGFISSLGEALDMATDVADAILECKSLMEALATVESTDFLSEVLDSADVFTMIVKIATVGFRKIVDYTTNLYETQMKLNEAAIAYRDTMHEISMMDAETIFGTDAMRQAAEGLRNLSRATSDLQDAQQKMKLGRSNNLAIFDLLASRRGLTGGWSAAYNEWNTMMDSTYEDSREYFEWLIANQEVIMSTMNKKQKAAFQNLLNSIESYKEAMDEVHDMMENIFGGLADTMADSLINAFIETGDAATDLANNMEDTFSELGKDIAKSLISSFIISNILNKYKDTAEALFTYMSDSSADPDVIAQKFGELADNITQDADAAAQFTNALLTALQTNGIDLSSEGGTKAMSNGIKSITEDTANLLASYINAIRADVSVTRTMIATILGLLPSAPTLSEYLAEIQANTYNTAVNTQFILEELRSTMAAYPNGGRAFNVNVS